MTQVAQRAKEVNKAVYSILERYPDTREDDRQLMLRYWSEVDGLTFDFTFPQKFAEKGTSPESITRARRAIQASGLFTPTAEAVLRRRNRQEELRTHFATH
jgi:hypothetical protein